MSVTVQTYDNASYNLGDFLEKVRGEKCLTTYSLFLQEFHYICDS